MSELIEPLASWRLLLVTVVVYGFAPGFVLRLIVRLYPRDDPRRAELVAELYTMTRLWRPFWVAEQLETGLFDGLTTRQAARRARHANVSHPRQQARRERWMLVATTLSYVAGIASTVVALIGGGSLPGTWLACGVVMALPLGLGFVVARRWRRRRRTQDHPNRT